MTQQPVDSRQSRDQGASSYSSQQQQQQQLSTSMPLFPPTNRQQQHLHSTTAPQQSASSPWQSKRMQPQDNHSQQQQQQQQVHQPKRPASSSGTADRTEASQHSGVQRMPLDVLLAPLLPSADETKLLDRLSQLRVALDEQHRLAASWEQQVRLPGVDLTCAVC
jgi:hypothetical protein